MENPSPMQSPYGPMPVPGAGGLSTEPSDASRPRRSTYDARYGFDDEADSAASATDELMNYRDDSWHGVAAGTANDTDFASDAGFADNAGFSDNGAWHADRYHGDSFSDASFSGDSFSRDPLSAGASAGESYGAAYQAASYASAPFAQSAPSASSVPSSVPSSAPPSANAAAAAAPVAGAPYWATAPVVDARRPWYAHTAVWLIAMLLVVVLCVLAEADHRNSFEVSTSGASHSADAGYGFGSDPYDSSDPYGSSDPYDSTDPYGSDPYGTDYYYGIDPYGLDPYGTDPYDTDPFGIDPYGTDSYSSGSTATSA